MNKHKLASVVLCAAGVAALGLGIAHAQGAGGPPANGYGYDPDGDSNPAINTLLIARIGDAAEARLDPPFKIITFEGPRASNGDAIHKQKIDGRTVEFSDGLTRQICEGQRYFRYDSACTYMRAPSGQFSAFYEDQWGRPLRIDFESPVCAAALAIYPTGGDEGEEFRATIQPYAEDGTQLQSVTIPFKWTNDTFRWRLMIGAYLLETPASYLDVTVESLKNGPWHNHRVNGHNRYQDHRRRRYYNHEHRERVRFLIDDVAFVENDCALVLDDIRAEAGVAPLSDAAGPLDLYAAPGSGDPSGN